MHLRPWILAAATWIAWSSLPALAGTTCIDADIGTDVGHRAVTLQLILPRGVHGIALAPIDGYRRGQLWRSPDGSAAIADDALRAMHPGQRRLRVTMDVSANIDRPDRTYPPFLRFADGTVAVETDAFASAEHATPLCLRFVPLAGEQVVGYGRATTHPLYAPAARAPAAYVAFGTPRVERFHSLMLVSDRQAPDWVRQRLHAAIAGVEQFYRQRMGPMAMPVVFLYDMPDARASGYHGDRLPGSVTLGLIGKAWNAPDAGAIHQLTAFVAHELFHVWNAAGGMKPSSDETNLASEGGAELASMFATASVERGGTAAWLDAGSSSLDNCLFALSASRQAVADQLHHGQLPYDCGVPVMLVLAALNDRANPVDGYFRAWKALAEKRRNMKDHRYNWSELAPAGADAAAMAALDHAVHGEGAYAASIQLALRLAGFVVRPQSPVSSSMRQRMNTQLMALLMASDCGGRTSFWSKPEGFLLDQPLRECHTLAAGKMVVSLLGQPFATDQPLSLAAAIKARCAAHGKLTATYADGAPAAELACPAKPVILAEPLQVIGYQPPG